MQQLCSNVAGIKENLDTNKHREEVRRLVAEAPDEPTYCEFKETLSYASKKEKGELVKDVSSFANADLEALGGYGYIIFGVSNDDGQIVGLGNLMGDPTFDVRKIVNGYLDRSIDFEYLTCEVDQKVGGTKRVAAIVVPDSKRRPHVVSREIKERLYNKDKFWLREGEIWVRKTGGREIATAADIDTMYEGKLRRLVDERVQPLQERVQLSERDLRDQRSATPKLSFGLAVPNSVEPSHAGQSCPVLSNLIDAADVSEEVEWAEKNVAAAAKVADTSPWTLTPNVFGPTSGAYKEYRRALEAWLAELQDLFVAEFVLANTGHTPAEDVEVTLRVPSELQPKKKLPKMPERPRDPSYAFVEPIVPTPPRVIRSKQTSPDSLIGPEINSAGAS